jgi:glycosyltransferase involved in cell wall biosynthesis
VKRATARSRSAVVQDWFFTPGGSEQVALELARLLPGSDVFTSFADAPSRAALGDRLRTWPLQRLVGPTRRYRSFLPLYPLWFGRLDLRGYDLVVSSSSAFAKAVRTRDSARHIAYIHTPMRYAWDLEGYVAGSSLAPGSRGAARTLRPWLQRWDRATAQRPGILIANSATVRERIRRFWGRDAEVIHPPVVMDDIAVSYRDDGYLLIAARMLAYRRLDLAVDACSRLGRELVVVGDGPERKRLESRAGPKVRFVGSVDRPALLNLFSRCHAYLVPGVEDFGIAPVEAMAAGKPVVGFRGGGVAESVLNSQTGVLFESQTADAMAGAIEQLDGLRLDPTRIRARAEDFSTAVFRQRFVELFERLGVDRDLYLNDAADAAATMPPQ